MDLVILNDRQSSYVQDLQSFWSNRLHSKDELLKAVVRRSCACEAAPEQQLARLHAPIGLDVGGRTPEETAVSICAEIIARRTGRTRPG